MARVLRTMEQLAVETDGHSIALSATAGVATFPADGRSAEELVAKAATTMYAAKASGPNRVAFYAGSQRA